MSMRSLVPVAILAFAACESPTEEVDTHPSLPSVSEQRYKVGEAVRTVLPEASLGNPPLTYALTPVPAGLVFDEASRTISGRPASPLIYEEHGYSVTDTDGDTDEVSFDISVLPRGSGPCQTDQVLTPGEACTLASDTYWAFWVLDNGGGQLGCCMRAGQGFSLNFSNFYFFATRISGTNNWRIVGV